VLRQKDVARCGAEHLSSASSQVRGRAPARLPLRRVGGAPLCPGPIIHVVRGALGRSSTLYGGRSALSIVDP